MSERLTKLFSLPANLYAEGSPLVISAGNLLRDNETGNVLVQLKIRNISMKLIKAVVVLVRALDTAGRPLEEETTQEYLDLSVPQGGAFGQKVPIILPNRSTRGIVAEVQEVVFSDNSTWKSTDAFWSPLPSPEPLSHKLGDPELVKQYKIKFGNPCDCWPQEHKDLWLCTCGTWNREDDCYRCKKNRTSLLGLDLDALKSARDARLAKEKADREAKEAADKAAAEKAAAEKASRDAAQKVAAEKRKRKNRRIACIITLIAALIVGGYFLWTEVIKPNQRYKEAITLFDAGKYEEAIAAFEALNGYKDSAAQIERCETAIKDQKYDAAIALYDAGKYEEAIAVFEALNGYKDSTTQIEACNTAIKERNYLAAIELLDAGKYEESYALLCPLDYKDSAKKAEECRSMIQIQHLAKLSVGQTVQFGYYEQDNDIANGKEAIEWIVLTIDEKKALLVSKYALDGQLYNNAFVNITWEKCSLRSWLNEVFYNIAFDTSLQELIVSTTVKADNNPSYNTDSGRDTIDKVFLLSVLEANQYFKTDDSRDCTPTSYAVTKGIHMPNGGSSCWWWLRTPGYQANYVSYVSYGGLVIDQGNQVNRSSSRSTLDGPTFDDIGAVRPALWISIE